MNYPAQPYNEVLDQLIANGVVFVNSNINGSQIFELVTNESNPTSFLSLRVVSTSDFESLPRAELIFNALEGLYVEQENTTFIASTSGVYCKYGSYIFQVNSSGYLISNPTAFRAASQSIGAIELNDALIALVSANTGRNPINGEAITYDLTNNMLIWGAPVYDNSLDFSAPFNSMYIPLLFRKF